MQLMRTDKGSWQVTSGVLNSKMQGEMTLDKIDLKLDLKLEQPSIKFPEGLSDWQKTLAESLNQQKVINISVSATGPLSQPILKVSSSLEKLFTQAIGKILKEKSEKMKDKYANAISERVGDLSSIENFNAKFDQWKSELQNKDKLLSKLKGKVL